MIRNSLFSFLALSFSLIFSVQTIAQDLKGDWFNYDPKIDSIMGIGVDRAYSNFELDTLPKVIVAVIDDGVDIFHPDLAGKIWINSNEIPNNQIDDDGNGYVDDVNGWNFLGNNKLENIEYETLELTRLYRSYKAKYDSIDISGLKKDERREYEYYQEIKSEYLSEVESLTEEFEQFAQLAAMYKGALSYAQGIIKEDLTINALLNYDPVDAEERQVIDFLLLAERENLSQYLNDQGDQFKRFLEYNYNLDYDPRAEILTGEEGVVQGNNMVWAADPEHGTHVAGIIAARRDNEIGINGIAKNAVILPIRAVPAGDERDEDIALSIRYAADCGAKIINMSFGKAYSPDEALVREAIEYAVSKDVLLIHASGNDGINLDKYPNYPDGTLGKKKTIDGWITVGASALVSDSSLLPEFSNYGRKSVDIIAPGFFIESLKPDSAIAINSGTSMAAPVVSGMAAVLRGKFPELSAQEIKELILNSVDRDLGRLVMVTERDPEKLKKLIRKPGVPNLSQAIKLGSAND